MSKPAQESRPEAEDEELHAAAEEASEVAGDAEMPAGRPATVEEERDDYMSKWQRARADYQNLKRRTLSDVQNAERRARQPLLEGMLQVLDYLDMALKTHVEGAEAKNVLVGVELTRGQLVQFLEQENVLPIPESGPFDPDLHEAIATVPDTDHEPGDIVDTVRRGYRWGDHVLRFAQVRVAAAEEADDEEPS